MFNNSSWLGDDLASLFTRYTTARGVRLSDAEDAAIRATARLLVEEVGPDELSVAAPHIERLYPDNAQLLGWLGWLARHEVEAAEWLRLCAAARHAWENGDVAAAEAASTARHNYVVGLARAAA